MTTIEALDHYVDSPARRPDWRWLRAYNILTAHDAPTTRERDGLKGFKWINIGMRFRSAITSTMSLREWRFVQEANPAVFPAYSLYTREGSAARFSLEANMLTNRDNTEIAHLARLPLDVVDAYEALFFDVRDALDRPSYIVNTVIAKDEGLGTTDFTMDRVWKTYAYFFGEHTLDAVQSMSPNPIRAANPEAVSSAVKDDLAGTVFIKAAIAAKALRVNQGNSLRLLEVVNAFMETAASASASGQAQESVIYAIRAMLDHMVLTPKHPGVKVLGSSKALDASAVELKLGDSLNYSLYGEVPDENSKLLLNFETIKQSNLKLGFNGAQPDV